MINALMCVYKSGDVLPLSLKQLVDCPHITRILIADGPHIGPVKQGQGATPGKYGPFFNDPSVESIARSFNSPKIFYNYTKHLQNRAKKNNYALKQVSKDCQWILGVDSDEVYHENDLSKLVEFLRSSPPWERYMIRTVDLYPDFSHELRLNDAKPRLFRYRKGYQCPHLDRSHQFVTGSGQKKHPKNWQGMFGLDVDVCCMFHLNALRSTRRITHNNDGTITVHIGGINKTSKIYPFEFGRTPRSIRESGKKSL